jgi:hypothetical protein
MPMSRARRHKGDVPWLKGVTLVIGGNETATRRSDQDLIRRVAVRAVDCSVLERHCSNP